MNQCLSCGQSMDTTVSWGNWLTFKRDQVICSNCSLYMEKITGSRCSICSRPSELTICHDCTEWNQLGEVIQFNYSVFLYNEWMKNIISLWKFRGDYVLREIFRDELKYAFDRVFIDQKKELILVPVPLSDKRMKERGFNQALALAEMLDMPIQQAIGRKVSDKQSKKSRVERLKSTNPFYSSSPIRKNVVLIDDIYTTGTTIRQAASILLENGCPEVYAFTLLRG
ncbi:late competence protein [Oceanobacillus iheyensis HTE831]|uniref:Late competence protein n=1 Tax=Oceanobacillus iheyensis (strain DSM 14371 / CIP 107618 / JCM 11309 / KCTC 3954 / HTE831) TaxID=221109 RepID=Q8ENG7_OCEIH|nr:ComF family protein [Oceanobacillus iheyensis]BAC14472.1 late competence protein [Oceanobacillus iheyensis HTE831]